MSAQTVLVFNVAWMPLVMTFVMQISAVVLEQEGHYAKGAETWIFSF